jgi:hypothetical protein
MVHNSVVELIVLSLLNLVVRDGIKTTYKTDLNSNIIVAVQQTVAYVSSSVAGMVKNFNSYFCSTKLQQNFSKITTEEISSNV